MAKRMSDKQKLRQLDRKIAAGVEELAKTALSSKYYQREYRLVRSALRRLTDARENAGAE